MAARTNLLTVVLWVLTVIAVPAVGLSAPLDDQPSRPQGRKVMNRVFRKVTRAFSRNRKRKGRDVPPFQIPNLGNLGNAFGDALAKMMVPRSPENVTSNTTRANVVSADRAKELAQDAGAAITKHTHKSLIHAGAAEHAVNELNHHVQKSVQHQQAADKAKDLQRAAVQIGLDSAQKAFEQLGKNGAGGTGAYDPILPDSRQGLLRGGVVPPLNAGGPLLAPQVPVPEEDPRSQDICCVKRVVPKNNSEYYFDIVQKKWPPQVEGKEGTELTCDFHENECLLVGNENCREPFTPGELKKYYELCRLVFNPKQAWSTTSLADDADESTLEVLLVKLLHGMTEKHVLAKELEVAETNVTNKDALAKVAQSRYKGAQENYLKVEHEKQAVEQADLKKLEEIRRANDADAKAQQEQIRIWQAKTQENAQRLRDAELAQQAAMQHMSAKVQAAEREKLLAMQTAQNMVQVKQEQLKSLQKQILKAVGTENALSVTIEETIEDMDRRQGDHKRNEEERKLKAVKDKEAAEKDDERVGEEDDKEAGEEDDEGEDEEDDEEKREN